MVVQRQLFEDQQAGACGKRKSIGNGYSIELVTDKILIVYRYGVIAKKVEIKTGIDTRRLVVEL
ncbi:MAG: hypothetical protein V1792_15910, partial [Pseudomonadota bacterium]